MSANIYIYVIHVNTCNCIGCKQYDNECSIRNGDPIICRACPIEIYKNGSLIYNYAFNKDKEYLTYTLNFIENINNELDLMKVLKTKLANYTLYNHDFNTFTDNFNDSSMPKYYVLTKYVAIKEIK